MLRALFIPTCNAGVTYYRMFNFWTAAHRNNLAEFRVLWWKKNFHEMHPWEREIHDPAYVWRITKEIQDWAIVSDVIIFGMLHGPSVKIISNDMPSYITQGMSLFRALKDMLPNKPILSEVDDNFISTPSYNPAHDMYAPEQELRQLGLTQFKESDGMIVSTTYLAEVYADYNKNINVVENCIDFKLWDKAKPRNRKGIRIGWAGGASHDEDLKPLLKIIPVIKNKYPEVTFVFVHGCPHSLRNLPGVEYHQKWNEVDKYPQYLASLDFDIGIAPLVDNSFNRGKSNLRWLEYSALKVPTVASNVGHFKETVVNGTDGFLADNENEFIGYLSALIDGKKLRYKMGMAANDRIRRDFNIDTVTQKYVETLNTVLESKEKEACVA